MRSPLPRVWDAVEGGLAEPTRTTISHAHQHTVGGDISIAGLEEARMYFHNQIRGHVIRPLDQWREALDVVEVGGSSPAVCGVCCYSSQQQSGVMSAL